MKRFAEQVIWLCIIRLALYITPLLFYQFTENPWITFIAFVLSTLLHSVIIYLQFKPIRKAMKVIDAATVFLNKTKVLLMVPCLFFIAKFITFYFSLSWLLVVVSWFETKPDDANPQAKQFVWDTYIFLIAIIIVLLSMCI